MTDAGLLGPLDGFGDDARRALASAEREARQLGHAEVGTEHLLLGLLADSDTEVVHALRDAGASLAAARHEVDEARRRPANVHAHGGCTGGRRRPSSP